MKIISFIDEFSVIKRILTHLNLWQIPQNERPPREDEGVLGG
jgi:hypothetical protein